MAGLVIDLDYAGKFLSLHLIIHLSLQYFLLLFTVGWSLSGNKSFFFSKNPWVLETIRIGIQFLKKLPSFYLMICRYFTRLKKGSGGLSSNFPVAVLSVQCIPAGYRIFN